MQKSQRQEIINRSRSAYKANNFAKAQEQLELLLQEEAADADADAVYLLALCFFRQSLLLDCENQFKRLLKLESNSFYRLQSHLLLAYIYATQNRLEDSETECYQLLESNVENAQVYSILGYVYHMRKDFAQADYYYQKALSIDSENANANNGLGYNLLMWKENAKLAEPYLEKALRLDADNPAYLDSMGWMFRLKKNFVRAIHFLTRAFQRKKHPEIERHLQQVRRDQRGADS